MSASPNDILIEECGERLVDIKTTGGILYGPAPECPETEPWYCLVRESVYKKLLQVQQSLPNGYMLRLYEGLRSLEVQAKLFSEELERVKLRSPHLSGSEQFNEATKLVSPVLNNDGTPNVPPHSTGESSRVSWWPQLLRE